MIENVYCRQNKKHVSILSAEFIAAKKRFISIVLFVILCFGGIGNIFNIGLKAYADTEELKTVRVGYYSGNDNLQTGFSDDERKSGYAYEYYQAIAPLAGWKYEYVYGERSEIIERLNSGDVEIVAGIKKNDKDAAGVLLSAQNLGVGEGEYFAVAPGRNDLLAELDEAMEQIRVSLPGFSANLGVKYNTGISSRQEFTKNENQWLEEHKQRHGAIKCGYVRHNLPLSDQDSSGNPIGIVKDMITETSDILNTEVEGVCFENITEMENALEDGTICCAFPMYSDFWLTESKGFRQTDSFISDRVMVVYEGEYTEDMLDTIAMSDTSVGQHYYVAVYYPDSKMNFYKDRAAAFDAIVDGKEKCMIGCSSVLQYYLAEHTSYQNLHIAYLDNTENFGIAVRQEESTLVNILNKVIRRVDKGKVTSSMMRYSAGEVKFTMTDMFRRYAWLIVSVLLLFIAVLAWVFINYRRSTNRFKAELEKALSAAEAANEAKTTFLSSMSHDIRTPMNSIVGMTTIAKKHMDDAQRVSDCLDKIALSSHHLLTLINDVLDISKIESGKLALNPVVFSLRDAVTTIVNIIRPQIQAKKLDFDVHIHGMEHEVILADEVRINQIFVNILSNAVKYTPEGGKVVMDLMEETLPDGENVRLTYTVADAGIGMKPEFMENMYETFSRATDTRIDQIQGTGLGLSIVKRMVDMMGGTIECESKVGRGTTFTVTLEVPIGAMPSDYSELPPVRILLVDDDMIFLESAGETLKDMGFTIDTANRGSQALDMVRSAHRVGEDYPIIIVDWKMPDMDGPETIQAIHDEVGKEVSIILASAYDWTDIEDEVRSIGITEFISKPLFRSYIYEKLRDILVHDENVKASNDSLDLSDLKGLHVLVAEDNELNWEVIRELLCMLDITADWAQNGKECVDMLSSAGSMAYDLVLMDIQMPVMNGWDATMAIRTDERLHVRTMPIVAMTADAFAEDIAKSYSVGMNGHVSKPVDNNKLIQEIRKALRSKHADDTLNV